MRKTLVNGTVQVLLVKFTRFSKGRILCSRIIARHSLLVSCAHPGHGSGMGALLAGGAAAAAAAYGASHLAHGAHSGHGGYAHGGYAHGGHYGHGKFKHGKFKHGKHGKHGMFGKHKKHGMFGGKFKKWK